MDKVAFDGLIEELPGVAIDRFDDDSRRQSDIYLLSHCHADHMHGLQKKEPLPGPLYLSAVSSVFICYMYPQHATQVRKLELQTTLSLIVHPENESEYELRVTAISANHCPGSVMFLLETLNLSILYTGDFRISIEEIKAIRTSYHPKILYLDSTFYHPEYEYFPNRCQSTKMLVTLCRRWLKQNTRNIISLWLPARYGSEYLFLELFKELREHIHVNVQQNSEYRYFEALDKVLTNNYNARIHACNGIGNHGMLLCRTRLSRKYIRIIKPSATRWKHLREEQQFWVNENGIYYVCYSNHASYGEIKYFLQQLQPIPSNVRYNVATDYRKRKDMEQLTKHLLKSKNKAVVDQSDNSIYLNKINYRNVEKIHDDDGAIDIENHSYLPKRQTNSLKTKFHE